MLKPDILQRLEHPANPACRRPKRRGISDIISLPSEDGGTGVRLKDNDANRVGGYDFGTFQGVFTPSILTIIGVVMYLRFGWVLGNVGIAGSLALVAIGSAITFLTGLSISTLATNMRMKGGGDNGALMLSLAVLLRRDDVWGRLKPRVNMLIRNRTPEEAGKQLSEFLTRARIESESRILATEGLPFTHVLSKSSADAALSLIGLRPPKDGETDTDYAEYLEHLIFELNEVPSPVFVLAAGGQELIRIFS